MTLENEIYAKDVKKEFDGEELDPFEKAVAYFNELDHHQEVKPCEPQVQHFVLKGLIKLSMLRSYSPL
jgi:hypothetical protein